MTPSAARALAARMMVMQGALLIAVAVLHLAMTGEIGRIVAANTTLAAYAFLWPPYQLDHVVVGLLLAALGAIVIAGAAGVRAGDVRAWRIALIASLAVFSLSPALALTVGLRYFAQAPAFLIAASVLAILGLWMTLPLLWIRKRLNSPPV